MNKGVVSFITTTLLDGIVDILLAIGRNVAFRTQLQRVEIVVRQLLI